METKIVFFGESCLAHAGVCVVEAQISLDTKGTIGVSFGKAAGPGRGPGVHQQPTSTTSSRGSSPGRCRPSTTPSRHGL